MIDHRPYAGGIFILLLVLQTSSPHFIVSQSQDQRSIKRILTFSGISPEIQIAGVTCVSEEPQPSGQYGVI